APLGTALAHALPVPALKKVFAAFLAVVASNLGRTLLPGGEEVAREARAAFVWASPDLGLCRLRDSLKQGLAGSASTPHRRALTTRARSIKAETKDEAAPGPLEQA